MALCWNTTLVQKSIFNEITEGHEIQVPPFTKSESEADRETGFDLCFLNLFFFLFSSSDAMDFVLISSSSILSTFLTPRFSFSFSKNPNFLLMGTCFINIGSHLLMKFFSKWQIYLADYLYMVNIPKCCKNDVFPKRRKRNMNIPFINNSKLAVWALLLSNFLRHLNNFLFLDSSW